MPRRQNMTEKQTNQALNRFPNECKAIMQLVSLKQKKLLKTENSP